ncbi:MAG: SWIM zinc finger family protein [Acidobacteria bacterium]|nr:SWIM zinc finger family protein [Acidobacteriota bacterium]MCA1636997.1 SWIM zinc finger family protein [Acidobacteriota bacterium]
MLEITNQDKFGKVIADAIAKVELTVTDNQTKARWINAISKAAAQIEENGVFMTWQSETKSLLIWSQESNEIYSSNGVCSCPAFKRGFACWHRAAARLVRLYNEPQAEEMNNAPYLKPTIERKAERVGGIRIN